MAKDIIHDAVKNALIKDGWKISADPFTIRYEDAIVFADLAAERIIAAEKDNAKIIVEIKSFAGPSAMQEFKLALGQYQTYFPSLTELGLEHKLYLAVGNVVFEQIFQRPSIQLLIKWHALPILVVNTMAEEVVTWTN